MVSTPDKQYRQPNDPYNEMEGAITRPSIILSDAENEATHKKPNKTSNTKSLTNPNQEGNQEGNQGEKQKDALSTLRHIEHSQASDSAFPTSQKSTFRNSVRGKKASDKKEKRKSLLKKAGPISAISGILLGGGIFFYAAQSMLAPHLSALYTQATDLQFTSYNLRNTRIMSYMIDGGNQIKVKNTIKRKLVQKYTIFTPYMQKRLAKNGIEVGHLTSSNDFEAGQALIGGKTVLKYGDKIIDANSFQTEFASNANFRDAYYNAKRGRIAGFFDDSAEAYYQNKGATRDIFDQYRSSGDEDTDMKNFKDTVSDRVTGTDSTINTVRTETDEETGEESIVKNGEDIDTRNIDGATPEAKARALVNNIAGKVSNTGAQICTAFRLINTFSIVVSAHQIYQSIAYFLSFMEPISKMMAGEGDASAINETLNFMTQQTASEVNYVGTDGKPTTKTLNGSMLDSSGAKLILGNTISPESAVQPFSLDNITKAATRVALTTGATIATCSGVLASSAIFSLTSTAIPGGKLASFVIGAVAQTIGGIALTGVIAAIINATIPYVTKMFASNIFETYTGIPAGELFSEGASTANFSLATSSSAFMPASAEVIKTQNHHTTHAIVQEAEIDRLHRSPLDISSPNTFLGSIMSKFSYLSYSNPIITSATRIASVVGSSTRSLIPTASALDDELSYTSQHSECYNLKGVECDMYGYPIVSADYSTIDIKPDDPTYISVISPNLDENGEVKDNSELAKFINFCVNRESPWGVMDANILNALQTDGGIVVNNLPVVNDIIDVVNAAEDAANQKWATGENCINSSSNPRWDSEFKYYQRFVEDMRIIYNMDDPETKDENPVVTYQNKYRETHPIDTSFKGTLSRISGLSMDDIAFMLEFIDYSNQIAKYNPSSRTTFGYQPKRQVKLSFIESKTPNFNIIPAVSRTIFIDRRNYII